MEVIVSLIPGVDLAHGAERRGNIVPIYSMSAPIEGKTYKVYRIRNGEYIGYGVADYVSTDSNYGFTATMDPFEFADGTKATYEPEFLGGVYRFEEVAAGGRRRKSQRKTVRRHRKHRKATRRSMRR